MLKYLKGNIMENVTKIDLENLDREDLEFGIEAAKQILKEYEDKLQQVIEQEEAELDPTAGVDVPDDYVYVLLETNDLQIHNIGEDICYECAEDLSRLGLIRNTAESTWVSARRNIRANRLEALTHSIGGAYEFEFGEDNYFIYVMEDGTFAVGDVDVILEPEKIYMTEKTAEQVCEILNSGTYKLNIDVAVEDDEFCEECCCDACAGNDC
jgi:hypothetical protein